MKVMMSEGSKRAVSIEVGCCIAICIPKLQMLTLFTFLSIFFSISQMYFMALSCWVDTFERLMPYNVCNTFSRTISILYLHSGRFGVVLYIQFISRECFLIFDKAFDTSHRQYHLFHHFCRRNKWFGHVKIYSAHRSSISIEHWVMWLLGGPADFNPFFSSVDSFVY